MGSCCCCGGSDDDDVVENKKLDRDRYDCSHGPIQNRRCTDSFCIVVYILHLVGFLAAVCAGGFQGSPRRLYSPRDYRGDYCGQKTQWNGGPDLSNHPKLIFTMNTSKTVEMVAKQFLCSSVVESTLQSSGAMSAVEWQDYLCACCKEPCRSCLAVLPVDDLTSTSSLSSVISSQLLDLSVATKISNVLSSGGQQLQTLGHIFQEACVTGCSAAAHSGSDLRQHRFVPDPDVPWRKAWDTLLADNRTESQPMREVIKQNFTFKALPHSLCPYDTDRCVPFPGLKFEEVVGTDFCMAGTIMDGARAAAGSMAGIAEALQAEEQLGKVKESIGSIVGNILETFDVLAIVSVLAIVISLAYLVLLRFFVHCAVWGSLMLVFLLTFLGGSGAYTRSQQCAGTDFMGSLKTYGTFFHTTAQFAVTTGTITSPEEAMTGAGDDYRGKQTHTRTGRTCQAWADSAPHNHTTRAATFPDSDLKNNYCRNPNRAVSIWCYTTDPATRWELCTPIGVSPFGRDCPQGYVVQDATLRKILEVSSYILLGISLLWLLAVFCARHQIRLAISVNIVAAKFVYSNPQVVLVPLLQAVISVAYCFIWALCAALVLSEVKNTTTPTDFYPTYAVAYGTKDTPGACTDVWPPGFVWKYSGDPTSSDDPCSGRFGDTSGITPRCWRCAQPRFSLDARFAISFFSLLWNNALLVAFGQCIIAGACAIWFFAGPGQSVAMRSSYMAFRYHFGSLAFGSFVLAVVQFIRYTLAYIEKQAQQQKNKVMERILQALQCCMYCFEQCLKFLTKNAYIQIAIMGKPFCTSAKNAFFLMLRNAVRFGTLELLSWVMECLGFAVIMAGTAVSGFLILDALHPEINPIGPMVLYVIIGYVLAELFISVFSLAVDSMLQCYIAAEELECSTENVPIELRRLLPDYKPSTE